ncbi:uncharacterized protein BN731_02022 [Prevotella sp. CAG:604]|nr:uncharacterized protein BN731_02022 [Prevotella sp. CAG:604]
MLCTCQTDTLGTECTSYLSIVWSICIGTDFHLGIFIAEIHQFLEVTRKLCSLCLNLTSINLTCSTIQRDEITLLVNYTFDLHGLSLIIYIDRASTRYAALTHTTSNYGSVRSHTTTSGKNTLGSRHTSEVFRRSLDTNHDDLLAILMPFLSIVCVEYDLTTSSTRRSRKTLCDDLSLRERQLIEYRVQQFIKFLWLTTEDSSLLIDHTLVKKIHSNLHHCGTSTLTVTCLEEPEFTFLYGELHILHIMIVILQLILQRIQFLVKFRHSLFHRRIFSYALLLRDTCTLSPALRTNLSNLLWRTDTSHYVLTLCIDEILTIEEILAITSIAREANTSSRCIAHITEYHRHHRHGSTPLCRNAFHLAIENSALVHPTIEYSADGTPKLIHRIVWEILTCLLLDSRLECRDKMLQFIYRHFIVQCDTALLLHLHDDSLEWVDIFLVDRLHAEHHVAIHLHETAIAVISKALITRFTSQALYDLIIQTKVEDGIHHTWHRSTSTGTYTN